MVKAPRKIAEKPQVKKAPRRAPRDFAAIRDALLKKREDLMRVLAGQNHSFQDQSRVLQQDHRGEEADDRDTVMQTTLIERTEIAIQQIDAALSRIREKAYGVCSGCGTAIPKARLEAMPFAERCVRCQSEFEQSGEATEDEPDWSRMLLLEEDPAIADFTERDGEEGEGEGQQWQQPEAKNRGRKKKGQ